MRTSYLQKNLDIINYPISIVVKKFKRLSYKNSGYDTKNRVDIYTPV